MTLFILLQQKWKHGQFYKKFDFIYVELKFKFFQHFS